MSDPARYFTCSACGLVFRSESSFDAHRVGAFEKPGQPNTRHCLTVLELEARGYLPREGVWAKPLTAPIDTRMAS